MILGRVSNLPTVWSNCLAGWWLTGGSEPSRLAIVIAGATSLYVGGMFLNDACDVEFDRQFCSDRPIPGGIVSRKLVFAVSAAALLTGVLLLGLLGLMSLWLALLLAGMIILYDVTHKHIGFAPAIMAICRFLLYLVAGAGKITLGLLVPAVGLAAYIAGISYLARGERSGSPQSASYLLLGMPILLAFLVKPFGIALVFSAPVLLCILIAMRKKNSNVPAAVGLLLAGIVMVDLLAVAPATPWPLGIFMILFGTTLVLQRYVPAS